MEKQTNKSLNDINQNLYLLRSDQASSSRKLNEQLSSFVQAYNSSTQEFVKLNSKTFDANSLITALIGLVGVLIGAFISYYFSKRLADSSQKARVAIQRKNLILSKLYKELVLITESLNQLPANSFYFELESLYTNKRYYNENF